MIQAIFVFLFSYYSNNSAINSTGRHQDLWSNGSIAYAGINLIVNIKILLSTCTHSFVSFGLFFYSVLSYYITEVLMSKFVRFEIFNSSTMISGSIDFYLSLLILVSLISLTDIGINRLMMLYGFVADPLNIKVEEYEPKSTELSKTVFEEKNIVMNNTCILK
jgi:hypothetical protein